MTDKNVQFYLSFENSICKDYVSEKFFEWMNYNSVQVVYNGANMSAIAPPHSYINVRDYQSVGDMVKDIKEIAEDSARFAAYFWWRDFYRVEVKYKESCSKI